MNKLFLLTLVLICFGCRPDKKEIKNDLIESGIKGKVKTVQRSKFSVYEDFGEIVKDTLIEKSLMTFNEQGNILESKSPNYHIEVKYDKNGNKAEFILYNIDGIGEGRGSAKYDDKKNMIESSEFDSEGKMTKKSKSSYGYNEKGKIINQSNFNSDDEISNVIKFIYNNQDNLIEEDRYDSENKLIERKTYKYNDKTIKIEEKEYSQEGDLYRIITYNDNGDITKEMLYNSKGVAYPKQIFSYDDKGNAIERESYFSDGELDFTEVIKYDNHNNAIETIRYYPNVEEPRRKDTILTEYDHKNNPIKTIKYETQILTVDNSTYEKQVPKSLTEIQIEYYD